MAKKKKEKIYRESTVKTMIEDFDIKLDSIGEYVADMPKIKTDVGDLKFRMGKVEKKLNATFEQVGENTKLLVSHDKTLKSQDKTLKSQDKTLKSHDKLLKSHDKKLGNIERDVKFIKGNLREKVDKDDFIILEKRVKVIERKLELVS
jgi:hypothetical protein